MLYTVREVATIFGVNEETVRRWHRNGDLKIAMKPRSNKEGLRFSDENISEFISNNPQYKPVKTDVKDEDVQYNTVNGPVTVKQLLRIYTEYCSGDLIRIVRCKDCKYYVEDADDECDGSPTGYCTWNPDDTCYTHKYSWCLKGDRRETNG